jgi:hypothetical protein
MATQMLSDWFPSTRPPVVWPKYNTGPSTSYKERLAKELNITVEEFDRRNEVCVKLHTKCQYRIGDKVYPHTKELYDKYGECTIMGISRDYYMYGSVEWNDPPFLLRVTTSKGKSPIDCTMGYMQKTIPTK